MATAESPVSESKIKCDGTEETAEKIKGDLGANIGSLIEAIKEVQGVCSEFDKEYYGKIPCEPEKMKELHDKLNETVDKLGKELKKAISEDIAIVFVGRTSSGKSSLINALFRNDFLPVTAVQTTMCKIQVRPTADEWSVDQVGCEKPLLNQPRGREDVVAFLNKISEVTNSAEREELNIDSHSVIQVKSPYPRCILPKNIVLIDTPGSKENPDGDEVVLDSCKEADILVAVINVGSPSIHEIAGLLNKVNCQFKFGVFTKWDKVVREKEEGKRQQVREKDEGQFQSFVKGKCMVYFVDAKHVTKKKETSAQASDDFLRFETDLAQSAKSVKAQKDMVLIKRAEDLTSEHNEDFEKIKSILERTEEHIDNHLNKIEGEICTLEEKQRCVKAMDQNVEKLIDLITPQLNEEGNNQLIEELGNKIESCPTVESENEAIDKFEKKIDGINKALQLQSEKVEKEYQELKDNLKSFQKKFPQQFLPPYEATLKKVKDCSYSSLTDPYAYVTSDNFWRVAFGCAAGTAAAAAAPALVASAAVSTLSFAVTNPEAVATATTAAATAGATAPTLVKKLSGSGIGQAIRKSFGPSKRRVKSIKEWARGNLMVIKTQCEKLKESASEGIRMIAEDLPEIEKEKDRVSGEKSRLSKEFSQLKKWSRKRTKSTERLQKVQDEFNKLKLGLRGKNTVSLEDQTENQSPVQPKDQEH